MQPGGSGSKSGHRPKQRARIKRSGVLPSRRTLERAYEQKPEAVQAWLHREYRGIE